MIWGFMAADPRADHTCENKYTQKKHPNLCATCGNSTIEEMQITGDIPYGTCLTNHSYSYHLPENPKSTPVGALRRPMLGGKWCRFLNHHSMNLWSLHYLPKSWQSPASITHFTSFSFSSSDIQSSGCFF